jgi:hypothetical protein
LAWDAAKALALCFKGNAVRPLTMFLSRLIGLLFLVLALATVLHRQAFAEIASGIVHDPPLLFVVGLITLIAGLALVIAHNIWSGGVLPVVITLFGWITLFRGLVFLLAPPDALASFFEKANFQKITSVAMAVAFVLGVYLTYMGFKPSRR